MKCTTTYSNVSHEFSSDMFTHFFCSWQNLDLFYFMSFYDDILLKFHLTGFQNCFQRNLKDYFYHFLSMMIPTSKIWLEVLLWRIWVKIYSEISSKVNIGLNLPDTLLKHDLEPIFSWMLYISFDPFYVRSFRYIRRWIHDFE